MAEQSASDDAGSPPASRLLPAASLGPCTGLRVLDLTSTIAGAVTTMLLADFGAEVLLAAPPGGHPLRAEAGFRVWQRGKTPVDLDLRTARGRRTARELAAAVDILVDDLPPGGLERLGLDPATLTAANPRLIHASITACGTRGPWRDLPADEALVTALSGIMRRQPGFRDGPAYLVLPLCSYAAALLALHGIGTALVGRERRNAEGGIAGETSPTRGQDADGSDARRTVQARPLRVAPRDQRGDPNSGDAHRAAQGTEAVPGRGPRSAFRVETSLLAGALAMSGATFVTTERPQPFDALTRLALGAMPLYRLYQAQDGRWLHLGAINARFWPRIALAVDRPELISDPRFQSPPRMDSNDARRALMDILAAEIDRRPFAAWDRILDEHDVPYAPAQTVDEFLHDPQVRHQEMIITVDDPDVGAMEQIAPVIKFGAQSADVGTQHAAETPRQVDQPPPSHGPPHTAAAGDDRAARTAFRLPTSPLAGVRVVDVSGYIAGPYGGAFLADLGADVIKVEGPDGDGLRGLHGGFLAWNRGKRGVVLDLRTDAGRDAYLRLAATADAIIENMRPGVAERLGIGYNAVRRVNPRIVYCYVSAYGSTGPYRHKPGVDPLMQARSGIERAQGGLEGPPVFLVPPVTDNTAAMLNAVGILLALSQRARTGEGQFLECSLLTAACLLQSDSLTAYEGRPPRPANDRDHLGPHALRRLYHCKAGAPPTPRHGGRDGWLMLACRDERDWRALCRALRRPDWRDDPRFATAAARAEHDRDLAEALAARFAALSLERALAALRRRRVPCAPATGACESIDDPQFVANGYTAVFPHELMGAVHQSAGLTRVNDAPPACTITAPLLGEHTRDVLAEAGLSAAEIEALIASGTAAEPSSAAAAR